MRFQELALAGAMVIEPERLEDERGFFARTWCRKELAARGLVADVVQCSLSFNRRKGTLRGLHYQAAPHEETKIVRCTMGAVYDVIVDLRPGSPTRKKWVGLELTAENRKMLYVPKGFAHGFLTIEDDTEVFYQMSEFYHSESVCGVRWNDAAFDIRWPQAPQVMSERDRLYADFLDTPSR